MNRIMFFLILLATSCVTTTGLDKLPEEFKSARDYYKKQLQKEASFMLDCKNLQIEDANKAFIAELTDIHTYRYLTTKRSEIKKYNLKVSTPTSFFVSGCKKRVKFILVAGDRKKLCGTRGSGTESDKTDYEEQDCILIQESSYVGGGKK